MLKQAQDASQHFAAETNTTVSWSRTVASCGCAKITAFCGAENTLSVAGAVVTDPNGLVTTTEY